MTDIIWILILCQNDVCNIFLLCSFLCNGWTLWNSTSILVLFSHLNICSYQEKLRGILLKLKIEHAQWSSFMIKVFAFKLLYLFFMGHFISGCRAIYKLFFLFIQKFPFKDYDVLLIFFSINKKWYKCKTINDINTL